MTVDLPTASSVADPRLGSIAALLLGGALIAAYGVQLCVEGIVGLDGIPGPTLIAFGIVVVGVGLAGHLLLAAARGYLSALWPGLVFPAAFCVFHFATLGQLDRGWYSDRLAPFAWLLSATCLLAWMTGHAISRGRTPFVDPTGAHLAGTPLSRLQLRRIAWMGGLVFGAGLLLETWILYRLGVTNLLNVDYVTWKSALIDAGVQLAATGAFALLLCMVGLNVTWTASALAERRLFVHPVVLVGFVYYVLVLVLTGDRSELTTAIIGMLLVRHIVVRPFRLRQVAMMAVAAAMLFGGIKYYRATKDVDVFIESATDPEVILHKNANETGFTLDTVVRSMELVPHKYDYFAGMTYVAGFSRVVPKVINPGGMDFVSSAWIIEETTDKRSTDAKGGLGFSPVAEAYINFGAAGAPFVLLLIGLLHGRIERWLTGPRIDPRLFALFLAINGALFLHTRNTAVIYIRGSIWSAMLIFTLFAVYGFLLSGANRPRQPPPSSSAGSAR